MRVGPAELMAFVGALFGICFGAAVGGRFGIMGGLGGGLCGAIVGSMGGMVFVFLNEWLADWLDRFAQKRRGLGIFVRIFVCIGYFGLLGSGFFYSWRVMAGSLKRMQPRPNHALQPTPPRPPLLGSYGGERVPRWTADGADDTDRGAELGPRNTRKVSKPLILAHLR
jgi:hypothetical protein